MPFFVPKRWNAGELFMAILYLAHNVHPLKLDAFFVKVNTFLCIFKILLQKL